MAEINGTNGSDLGLTGTAGADVILALLGADNINGLAGADVIDAGGDFDADNILGAEGNDTIRGTGTGDIIDGGADSDTLQSDLQDGDDLNGPLDDGADPVLGGLTLGSLLNMEWIEILNAGGTRLDLASDGQFGFSQDFVVDDSGAADAGGAVDSSALLPLRLTTYQAATGAVTTTLGLTDLSAPVVIDGMAYMSGDSFVTSGGGTVTIGDDGHDYTFTYTPDPLQMLRVGDSLDAEDDVLDMQLAAQVTDDAGNAVTVTLRFAINHDATVDFSDSGLNVDIGTRVAGDDQNNTLVGNGGDDTLPGGDGDDSVLGDEGNDVLFAGAGDTGDDTLRGGEGGDTLGGGAGDDALFGDDGWDLLFGGDGSDALEGGNGNDTAWAGEDFDVLEGGEGDDQLGGGNGADNLFGDDGNDLLFGGADDGDDFLQGDDGQDTLFAGGGADILGGGAGDDLLFNGAGDDTVSGDGGADTLWGGPGNDSLTGGAGDDSFAFAAEAGSDTISDFQLDPGPDGSIGDRLDLGALAFADTDAVLDAMVNVGGDAVLVLSPGHTVTFENLSVSDFASATDDWVLV